jgi:ferritin-like metal-binding protein YciE
MSVENPRELFVMMLSDLRQGTERSTKFYQELARIAEDPDIKEALEARVFVSGKILNTLDECFKVIGEKPVKVGGRLIDAIEEDFRRELAEIQSPEARRLLIIARSNRLAHLRIGEYVALIAAADLTGHYGVGVLLESCLADKMAFVERSRQLIRNRIQQRLAA